MDVVSLGLAKADAAKKYAPRSSQTASLLAALMPDANTNPFPPVMATPPTVVHGTTKTITARTVSLLSDEIALIGVPGTWNTSTARVDLGWPAFGLDFTFTGDAFEVSWTSAGTNIEQFWLWIDGVPVTAAPTSSGLGTQLGFEYVLTVTFPSSGRRHVTLYADGITAWRGLRTTTTSLLSPAIRLPKVAFVGDSFFAGGGTVASALMTTAQTISRLLGVEAINRSRGGTGWGTATLPYDDPTRIASVAAAAPDLLVFSGSVNDTYSAGLQARVTSTLAAYATACPNVPAIVFGVQPSNGPDTIGTPHQQTAAAVRAGALAAPNVIAYHDMIGTSLGAVPAWSGSATYNPGDRVTYQGSVWERRGGPAGGGSQSFNTPSQSERWALVTWQYTGTGTLGAPAANGTRDVLLQADGVHPTQDGHNALAIRQAAAIRSDLIAYAKTGTRTVS